MISRFIFSKNEILLNYIILPTQFTKLCRLALNSESNLYRKLLFSATSILLAGVILAPLTGFLSGTAGIPVWYQDTFMFGWIMLILSGGVAAVGLWTGGFRPVRWTYIDFAILALVVYMMIRASYMEFTPQSAWAQISFLAGSYFIPRMLWSTMNPKGFQLFLVILLTVGILETVYGLGQLYGWWPSHHDFFAITGTFSNPGPYSGWLACLIPISIYGILQGSKPTRNRSLHYTSWIYLALASLVLVPATSRAAFLAAGVGSIVVAWPRIKKWGVWNRSWVKGTIAVVLMIGLLGLYLIKKDSADGRLLIYKVTTNMISEAPILGWGWDGFPKMYNTFQSQYFSQGDGTEREKYLADNVMYGFNELLEFTAEMGMVGLVMLSAITVLLLRKWRKQSLMSRLLPLDYLGLGVVTSWCTFGLFSYPFSIPTLAVILPVAAAGLITGLNAKDDTEADIVFQFKKSGAVSGKIFSLILILTLGGSGAYWVSNYQPIVRKWVAANVHQSQQRYDQANRLYLELYPELENEGWFLQYAGKSFSLNQQYVESAQMLERALHFSADPAIYTTLGMDYTLYGSEENPSKKARAESLLSHVKFISPYKYYPRYLLAQHYFHTDQIEKAVAEAERVMEIVPKIASPATNDIRLTMKRLVEQEIFQPEKTRVRKDIE